MTQSPRPRSTSRTPASRPRRIAGRGSVPAAPAPDPTQEPVEEPEDDVPAAPEPASDTPVARPSMFAGARVTRALLVTVVLLTMVTLGLAGYLWLGEDDPAPASAPPAEGEIAVPEDRPIQLPFSQAQGAAEQAAEAATTALATSWKDYDAQLDEAVALMTPGFAEEFRTTATDARAGVVEGRLEIAVRVVAQSVVRANATEVQAMLFLDQYTTSKGEEQGTTVSPYRVLVTLVNTDGGWLVSDLQTR